MWKCENVRMWKCDNVVMWKCENAEMNNCGGTNSPPFKEGCPEGGVVT